MRHVRFASFVWVAIALASAAPARAQPPIRVLTDADVPVNPATVGDHDTVRMTPLYGGSDRSAYTIEDEQRETPALDTRFVLADFPTPSDLAPGDLLVGLASAASDTGFVPPGTSAQLEVALTGPYGQWGVVGHADVRCLKDRNADLALRDFTAVRVPVPFDRVHRPARVRVTAVLPNLGASVVHCSMTISGPAPDA